MSRAIASARQRRAGVASSDPVPTSTPSPAPSATQGLTIHQVINLVDIRLIKLEKFMEESSQKGPSQVQSQVQETDESVPEILDEFEHRFQLLANEIDSIREIVLKLQSYTMDVNRKLLEDKHVLNVDDSKTVFTMHSTEDLISSFDDDTENI